MLPVEMEFLEKERPLAEDISDTEHEWDTDDIVQQAEKMAELKQKIHAKAKVNIDHAQEKDKMYYDRKHADPKVRVHVHLMSLSALDFSSSCACMQVY